jgi:hypothetical protein
MRWQKFLRNFWKSTIIKASAFSSIFLFDRNFLKERKDFIAERASPQTWTIAVLRCEFITHEFWDVSFWNKQRRNKNMLSWCNQTLGVCCSSDMVPTWLVLSETSSSPQKKTCSDITTKYRLSAPTLSYECIVLPIFLCRKFAMLSLFRTHTVCSKV